MQPKLRRHPNGAFVSDAVRRSASGASTASHDSSITHDSGFEVERRYAPLQPQPVVQQPHAADMVSGGQQYGVIDHAAMEQLNHYNNTQPHNYPVDAQQIHAYHSHNPFAPTVPSHQTQIPQNGAYYTHSAVGLEINSYHEGRSLESMPPTTQGGTDVEKKDKKASNTTAANEKELRELLEKNEHRSLESIARDVRNAERTQKSEKAKQLFAMRWLRQYCRQDRESVPRNRVYTHYAQRCGTDRVDILNAASFGKLVRVIFPGIQTRRLGVRGESKYHYVALTLCEDNGNTTGPPSARGSVAVEDRAGSPEAEQDFGTTLPRIPADSAAFPAQDQAASGVPSNGVESNPGSQGRLFADTSALGYRSNGQPPHMFTQSIKFTVSDDTLLGDEPMQLPNIYPFLPPKTDTDTADALAALYRTHCTSLIDSVRYVKERQFTRLLGSFHGTMTVPVSKLFSHHYLAPWIQLCDWLMYQQVVRFVSQLALQVIPQQVFTMLGNVSNTLTQILRKNLQNYPEHVTQAKLEPATIFSALLKRLLRVNETAHAAANLLTNDQMRNMMWQDWVRSVKPKRVVETELPECGHEEVYNVLTKEIRRLLEPLEPSDWYENGTEYQTFDFVAQAAMVNASAEGILDRWSVFLSSLPGRFPKTHTRNLLQYISTVGTASLRDITVNQAQSFGGWWITKVWVDEMMLWLAEIGGFLETRSLPAVEPVLEVDNLEGFLEDDQKRLANGTDARHVTSLGLDFEQVPNFEPMHRGQRHTTCPPMTTFKYVPSNMAKSESIAFFNDHHDDSGIGMSLLGNDDLDNTRMDFGDATTRPLVS